MTNASTARVPISTLDDDAWDDLLSFIEQRRVIPIVGPELLQVTTEPEAAPVVKFQRVREAQRAHG